MLPRYLAALRSGDERTLLSVLAADVRFVSDGGGKIAAARKPLEGAPRVAHVLAKIQQKLGGALEHRLGRLNGETALLTFDRGRLWYVTFIQTDGQRIAAIYRVLNPEKLARLQGMPLDR
jgi:RNA polymerase sigma-70 factor (ECF subfamily)